MCTDRAEWRSGIRGTAEQWWNEITLVSELEVSQDPGAHPTIYIDFTGDVGAPTITSRSLILLEVVRVSAV